MFLHLISLLYIELYAVGTLLWSLNLLVDSSTTDLGNVLLQRGVESR